MTTEERLARRHDRAADAYEDAASELRDLYVVRPRRAYIAAAAALRRLARDERASARRWRRPWRW